tara:strand:- start:317 stop:430 length:114 start_codon:yes stop_codon:yes gene_type:complete
MQQEFLTSYRTKDKSFMIMKIHKKKSSANLKNFNALD